MEIRNSGRHFLFRQTDVLLLFFAAHIAMRLRYYCLSISILRVLSSVKSGQAEAKRARIEDVGGPPTAFTPRYSTGSGGRPCQHTADQVRRILRIAARPFERSHIDRMGGISFATELQPPNAPSTKNAPVTAGPGEFRNKYPLSPFHGGGNYLRFSSTR